MLNDREREGEREREREGEREGERVKSRLGTCNYPPDPEKAFFVNQHVMWFANQEFEENLST